MSIIGELLLWTPPVPRDTFLEENIIALVFAIVGVGSSFGGGKRLMFEANRLVPGLVVVVVCWVAMLIIVMLLLFLIEAVEKLNAFIVVHKEHLRLKDTALDLEERLHRHEVRERCVALEALWKDYEEATMLEDARGMAPSATDLSSLLAHVEDDPNAAVARENDLFVSAQARIEEQRLGLSRGPMTHEVKGPPVMVASCVEINQCVGCTRQFFTKSFLGDDAAVLARSSGEERAPPRCRAGVASMAWRTTRRFSTDAP